MNSEQEAGFSSCRRSAFGRLLAIYRKRDGRSQLHLALDAGISSRHLGFLELGRSRPSADMVRLLSEALSLAPFEQDELLLAAGFAPRFQCFESVHGPMVRKGGLGSDAFDTAVAIAQAHCAQAASQLAQRFFARIGISHFMTGMLRHNGSTWEISRDDAGEPAIGWLKHNELNGYRDKDYLVAATAASASSFFWTDIGRDKLTAEQRRIIDEARDFGIRNGFVMPVHMGDGSVRALSSWAGEVETGVETRMAASLVATALIDSMKRLKATRLPANGAVRLASSQRELLGRIAQGGSARRIARILTKPEAEVRRMIAHATSAMGCATPAHAASRATALGLI